MNETVSSKPINNSTVMPLEYTEKAALLAAFMPFIKNGGLFIRTDKSYRLGEEVFLLIKLMDIAEKFTIAGKVVWISPKGAQDGMASGIGVQFDESAKIFRSQIETILAGSLQSERRTDTM